LARPRLAAMVDRLLAAVLAVAPVPPAVPLITADPFLSAWSEHPRLTDDWPRHWSGATLGMSGMVRVDGRPFRWCGPIPSAVPAATETSRWVQPLSSGFAFREGGIEWRAEFLSLGGLAESIAASSRTVGCVRLTATSLDGRAHSVETYLDLTGEWCTNDDGTLVSWSRHRANGADALSMGALSQEPLAWTGDRRRIEWGRVFLAPARHSASKVTIAVAGHEQSRTAFAATGVVPDSDDLRMPRAVNDDWPVLAASSRLAIAADGTPASCDYLVLLDERYCVEYFKRPLEPAWTAAARGEGQNHDAAAALAWASAKLADSEAMAHDLRAEERFVKEARAVGGDSYANLVTLAFRQVMAGHSIAADFDGSPLMFSKENTSNGCIGTIDVIYPACPFFLVHNPAMLRAQLRPLLEYAASPRWRHPFAPHDLGTYPKANGQVYGGGEVSEENQMPVEESANMLIMLAALAKVEGSVEFSREWLPMLDRWAEYLQEHGLDPARQLCTDDFAGHLARNVNLSAKSIVALGAYAQLLHSVGRSEESKRWRNEATRQVAWWIDHAAGDGATRLVFGDGPAPDGAWSQKYNLVWDRALGLRLFPREIVEREVALYRTKLERFGLPLDSRQTYTKLDWTVWTACLTGSRRDFDTIMAPVYEWVSNDPPPSRVPLTDWYETRDGTTKGMYARTVVGGLWMPLLLKTLGAPLTE